MELSTSIPTRNAYGPRTNVVWHSAYDYGQRLVGEGITTDSLGHEVTDLATQSSVTAAVNRGGRSLESDGTLLFV